MLQSQPLSAGKKGRTLTFSLPSLFTMLCGAKECRCFQVPMAIHNSAPSGRLSAANSQHYNMCVYSTKQYLAPQDTVKGLGKEKAKVRPLFQALTGCDTASAFLGHGKWPNSRSTWIVFPELTSALLAQHCNAPVTMEEDHLRFMERVVILLHDRTSKTSDMDKARKKPFAKRN